MDHLAEVATHSMVSCVSLDKSGICLPRESCGVEKVLRQVCLEHMRIRKHVNPNLQCKAAAFGPEIILGFGWLTESLRAQMTILSCKSPMEISIPKFLCRLHL